MDRWRWIIGALVAVHLVAGIRVMVTTEWDRPSFTSGDSMRYRQIAHASGLPYRDVEVEFPPVSWAAVELVGAGSAPAPSGRALVALQLLCDAAVAVSLLWGWSQRAATGHARAA